MIEFIEELKHRNAELFFFGLICILLAVGFLVLSRTHPLHVAGANAWFKPFKFALSTALYSWSMAWFVRYLADFNVPLFSWTVIVLLGLEILYIAVQAARGQLSHFNSSSPLYSLLYSGMAIAATGVAMYTAFVGVKFFQSDFAFLPDYYLWSIRLAIILFVVFCFEGFVMGSRMAHTIGGPDGGPGLPIVGWSTRFGDPRIAHFVGMHALQILPVLSFYVLKNLKWTFGFAALYALLAIWVLVQALAGKPLIGMK